jgi:hypothetical protein
MVHKVMKAADGKYHISGKTFENLEGSRAQVWHGTAFKTPGGLKKDDLIMNKNGRIVSKKKHATAKRDNRLVKAGFLTKKGTFGFIKSGSVKSKKSSRKTKKSRK